MHDSAPLRLQRAQLCLESLSGPSHLRTPSAVLGTTSGEQHACCPLLYEQSCRSEPEAAEASREDETLAERGRRGAATRRACNWECSAQPSDLRVLANACELQLARHGARQCYKGAWVKVHPDVCRDDAERSGVLVTKHTHQAPSAAVGAVRLGTRCMQAGGGLHAACQHQQCHLPAEVLVGEQPYGYMKQQDGALNGRC